MLENKQRQNSLRTTQLLKLGSPFRALQFEAMEFATLNVDEVKA
jgi:hypothetical protein